MLGMLGKWLGNYVRKFQVYSLRPGAMVKYDK